jgi:TatD DNase family protein
MPLTDTHCHFDLEKFDVDRAAALTRAEETGLTRILIPGITLTSSRAIVKLAESHPMLYAGVGVHPTDAGTWDNTTAHALETLTVSKKVVAIGEIGLDYYWDAAPAPLQWKVLEEQLDLAARTQLPAVIHLREAGDAEDGDCARDLLKILEKWATRLRVEKNPLEGRAGVLHSFSGSLQTAQKAIQMGFYIGFTGPITYKNAQSKREVAANLPLERILIETDAPYLAPVPQRGKRNEPAFVAHIADKIAEIHNITREQAQNITSANAKCLFAWEG